MKSSLISFLPSSWSHSQKSIHKPKPELSLDSVAISRSSVKESDKMKESLCLSNQHSHVLSRQRKMPPLLRLDSEGEISTGNNFCDRAVSSHLKNINDRLQLTTSASSFESSFSRNMVATLEPAGTSNNNSNTAEASSSSSKNIPRHPSFKKSFSDPIGLPAHQSFPPPSLSLGSTKNYHPSPYSSSPRLLGSVNIFGVHSPDKDRRMSVACKGVIYSSPEDKKMNVACKCKGVFSSSACMDECFKKIQVDDSNRLCTNLEDMNVSKLNIMSGVKSQHPCDNENKDTTSETEASVTKSINDSSHSSTQSFNSNDSSSILLIRKKKRKRSRNRKKKGKRNDNNDSVQFTPSSCSSPLKNDSKFVSSKGKKLQDSSEPCPSGMFNVKIVSPICQIFSKSKKNENQSLAADTLSSSSNQSSLESRLICSDTEHSVSEEHLSDDDLVFEDSNIVFLDDSSPKCSSKVSSKKRKFRENRKPAEPSDESDDERKPSLTGLHLTLSLTLSEDEENDSSVDWDCSASPSENNQFLYEFEFNSGLSLDNIFGQATSSECAEKKAADKRLRDVNSKWNKFYTSTGSGERKLPLDATKNQKVHFADDKTLETVHVVGDEDRGGEWQRFALERSRFQRRIQDVEKILAPFLCEDHRSKVRESMSL